MNESASPMAIVALVLGILSWMGGSLLTAIPGAIIGKMEMNKIAAGQAPAAGDTFAKIGFWASVVNIVLSMLGICGGCVAWLFMFGGMAVLGVAGGA